MKAEIKYTVKYHDRPVKKVAEILLGFSGLIILLLDLVWAPLSSLTPDLQAFALFHVIPKLFWDFNNIALISLAIGLGLYFFRWRKGTLELTDEKLIITGSYFVSIGLKNMWEVEVCDLSFDRWKIVLDSNVDAVKIKFRSEEEFEAVSEKLVQLVSDVENIKLKISA